MTFLPLLAVGTLMKFVAVLFVLVSIVLVLVILVQKGRGGGLSGAFGGGMASGLLGSKTGDFLTWLTIGLVVVWLGMAVLMAKFFRPSVSEEYDAKAPGSAASAPASGQPAGTTTEQQPTTPAQSPTPAAEPTPAQPGTTESAPQAPTGDATPGGSGGQ
ncbi:MAG: preprotein translocase subunit SecG [Phycisphaerae bacterium]|nr:preprotein translocase subunit SecG [Phycisphaerae bacterium]